MKEFKNAVELLTLCTEKNLPISEIMRQREIILGETTAEDVDARMAKTLLFHRLKNQSDLWAA